MKLHALQSITPKLANTHIRLGVPLLLFTYQRLSFRVFANLGLRESLCKLGFPLLSFCSSSKQPKYQATALNA